jgi:hypothetical protein
MGWNRKRFQEERKQPRHAHLPLAQAYCADCGRELPVTHVVARFGERCKHCFEAFWQGAMVSTASHEGL